MGRQRTDLTSTLPNNDDGVENNPDLYIDTTQDAPDHGRHSPGGESECTSIGGFSHYKLYDHAQSLIHHHHNSSHHNGGSGGGISGGGLPHYGMISQHSPYLNHPRAEDLSLMPPSTDTGVTTTSSGALHHHSATHLRSSGYSQDSYYASTNNNNNNNGTNHVGGVDETQSRHQSVIDNQNQHGLQQLTCLPVVKYEPVQQSQDSSESSPVSVDAHIDKSVFTIEHVNCVCRILVQEKNYFQLSKFLTRLPKEMLKASDEVVRAQAVVAYQSGDFPLLYALLQSRIFPPEYHTQLQTLWYNAHYTEAEKTRGRKLGAVDKYRIRKKHPRPKNIWDGEETIYTFKERSRSALKECFRRTRYPNPDEKKQLSMITNLTITQVGNWFKNKRQRDRTSQARDPGSSDGLVITPVSSNGSSHPAHLPYSFHPNDRKSPIYSSKPPRLENGQLVFSNGRKRLPNLDLYDELKSARMIDGDMYSPPLDRKRSRAGTNGSEDTHPHYSNLVNKLPTRQSSAEKDTLTGFPHDGKLNKRGGNNNSGAEYYNNSRNNNLGKKSGKQQRNLTPNPNQFDTSPMGGLGHHPPPGSPIMRLVNSSVSSSTGSSSLTNGFGSQHYNTSAGGIDRSPNINSPATSPGEMMHHGGYSHGCNPIPNGIQHLQAGGHYIQNPAQFSTFTTTGTPFDSIISPLFQSYSCHASATLSHA